MGSCSAGHCRAAEVYTVIVLAAIVPGVVMIALWLWMAQHNGQGRNWARIVPTVLFALATLALTDATTGTGIVFGATAPGMLFPALTWLAGPPRCGCRGARPAARSSTRRAPDGSRPPGQGCQDGLQGYCGHGTASCPPRSSSGLEPA